MATPDDSFHYDVKNMKIVFDQKHQPKLESDENRYQNMIDDKIELSTRPTAQMWEYDYQRLKEQSVKRNYELSKLHNTKMPKIDILDT